MTRLNKLVKLWPFLLILLVSLVVLLPNLTKPFIGHHDWNGVYYSQIARNYLQYPLKVTKLGQMTGPNNFYTHYPPLMPLLLALNFLILGVSDWSARLLPIAFTILTLLTIYRMTQKLKLKNFIGLSSVLIIFTPMLRYFSHMPSQEALMVFFSVFSVNLYLSLILKPKPKHQYELYIVTILNGLTGWAGYFIYPILAIHAFFKHKKVFPIILKTIGLLFLTFTFHLVHTYLLTGSLTGGGLIDAFLLRLNLYPSLGLTEPELPGQFSLLAYIQKQASILTIYYTATLLLTSFLNFLFIIFKLVKKQSLSLLNQLVLIFLAWGLTYPIIFSNVVFVHEYFNLFFWPFLAFSLVNLFSHLQGLSRAESRGLSLKVQLTLLMFIGGLIFFERNNFFLALNDTQAHLPGYQLGNSINQTVPEGQTAYIIALPEEIEAQAVFIKFYANRQLKYLNPLGEKQVELPDTQYLFYNILDNNQE
jgi:4-amino-4-deoxy-L-arabinose transferase-like glycosyltransferase